MYLSKNQVEIIDKKLKTYIFKIPTLTMYDDLLKIPDKNALLKYAKIFYKQTILKDMNFAIIFMGIDGFGLINNDISHDGGDFLLKEIVSKIKTNLVENKELIFRFGGEEFLILLPGYNNKSALEKAENIRKMVEDFEITYKGYPPIKCTLSIGVSVTDKTNISWEDFLINAELAEKKAKANGKNQVV